MFILETASTVTDADSLAARNIIFLLRGETITSTFTHSRCRPVKIKWRRKKKNRAHEDWRKKITSEKEKKPSTPKPRLYAGLPAHGRRRRPKLTAKKQGWNGKKTKPKLPSGGEFGSPRPGDFLRSGEFVKSLRKTLKWRNSTSFRSFVFFSIFFLFLRS